MILILYGNILGCSNLAHRSNVNCMKQSRVGAILLIVAVLYVSGIVFSL